MPTLQKAQIIEEIQGRMQNSNGIYFTKYTGVNVEQITKLRHEFRDNEVEYKVTKNTLTRIAAHNIGIDSVDGILNGQIGIAYSSDDPVAPARVIKKFIKDGGKLEVVGILFEGEYFDAEKYKELADLPSREELLSKLLSGLSQPMSQLASTLNGAMTKFIRTLDSLKNSKE